MLPKPEPALELNAALAVVSATQSAVVELLTGVPLTEPIPNDTISVVRFCKSKLINSVPPYATKASH